MSINNSLLSMRTPLDDIYELVIRHDSRVYVATVYRTISFLVAAGILSRIALGDGKARYEEDRGERHEHLVDVETGKVVELRELAIEELLRQIAERCGCRLRGYRLQLFGAECRTDTRLFGLTWATLPKDDASAHDQY